MDFNLISSIAETGRIIVDARYLHEPEVSSYLVKLILKVIKVVPNLKLELIISLTESYTQYKEINLIKDGNNFDVGDFFEVVKNVNFEENTTAFLKDMIKENKQILFISQDQSVSFDMVSLFNNGFPIYARRVEGENLVKYPMITDDILYDRPKYSYIKGRSPKIDKIPQECKIPGLNDIVIIGEYSYRLQKQIGFGGEGKVFLLNDELVVKVFNKERLTKTRIDKIQAMTERRINDFSICWPISIVKNTDNFIVGYTMKRCFGNPISTIYRGKEITKELYPNFNELVPLDIAILTLEKIQKLHNNNILLGDINDRNFLIDDLKHVYLIDTDSYQFEDFSCDVGTIGYIAPELKEGVLSTTLRSFEDESYAIAVFVFRTLMQGHFPFAQTGTDAHYVELIKKQDFPYHMSGMKTKKYAPPKAVALWSNIPNTLKQMFIDTFTFDKKISTSKRYTVEEWKNALILYRRNLNKIK